MYRVPPNLRFEVDDFEADWTYEAQFDFIHARDLQGSVSDYNRLVSQAYGHLNPGGWFEFAEVDLIICSDDDTIHRATSLRETTRLVKAASAQVGRVMGTATEHTQRLANAGFINITEDVYKVSRLILIYVVNIFPDIGTLDAHVSVAKGPQIKGDRQVLSSEYDRGP